MMQDRPVAMIKLIISHSYVHIHVTKRVYNLDQTQQTDWAQVELTDT